MSRMCTHIGSFRTFGANGSGPCWEPVVCSIFTNRPFLVAYRQTLVADLGRFGISGGADWTRLSSVDSRGRWVTGVRSVYDGALSVPMHSVTDRSRASQQP